MTLLWSVVYLVAGVPVSAAMVRNDYQCEAKGTIDVKGADQMEVWHVIGRKAAST